MQAKKGATHELYKALGQIRVAYATRNCPIGFVVPMRDEKVVRALHEPCDALLVNEQVTYPGFMASTHVKILEVFPFHEPPLSRPAAFARATVDKSGILFPQSGEDETNWKRTLNSNVEH